MDKSLLISAGLEPRYCSMVLKWGKNPLFQDVLLRLHGPLLEKTIQRLRALISMPQPEQEKIREEVERLQFILSPQGITLTGPVSICSMYSPIY